MEEHRRRSYGADGSNYLTQHFLLKMTPIFVMRFCCTRWSGGRISSFCFSWPNHKCIPLVHFFSWKMMKLCLYLDNESIIWCFTCNNFRQIIELRWYFPDLLKAAQLIISSGFKDVPVNFKLLCRDFSKSFQQIKTIISCLYWQRQM